MIINKNYTDNRDAENKYVPKTPVEKILAKMNGDDIDVPYPNKPLEYQLKRLSESYAEHEYELDMAISQKGVGWTDDRSAECTVTINPKETDRVVVSPPPFAFRKGDVVTIAYHFDSEAVRMETATATASGLNSVAVAYKSIRIRYNGYSNTIISTETLEAGDHTIFVRLNSVKHMIDEEFLPDPGPEIPTPTSEDSGKILGVNSSGEYYIRNENPNELPTPTAQDEGKIVGVDQSGEYYLRNENPNELPTPTAQDSGKIVYVDGSGNYILDNLPSETWTVGLVTYTASTRAIAVGTAEFEDGVTDLPTGVIYLQIEE